MNTPRGKAIAAALVAAGLVLGSVVGAVVAGAAGRSDRTAAAGGAIDRVGVVRSTAIFNTSTTSFATIPGATIKVTVPAGEHVLLIARFTTQDDCTVGDQAPTGHCLARILANTTEMAPASGGSIIDSVQNGAPAGIGSAALDRSIGPVGPGTYTIAVQVKVTSGLMILEVTDWHITVERVRVS